MKMRLVFLAAAMLLMWFILADSDDPQVRSGDSPMLFASS